MKKPACKRVAMELLALIVGLLSAVPLVCAATPDMPRFRFENFTTANGLPDNHIFAVLVDGNRVWAGTENGLALYENHQWKTYTTQDGLAHRAVLSLALDKRTGDVWAGTMGGLSRVSAGRIESYTPMVEIWVYGVSATPTKVYFAVWGSGLLEYDQKTGRWDKYEDPDGEN